MPAVTSYCLNVMAILSSYVSDELCQPFHLCLFTKDVSVLFICLLPCQHCTP